MSVPMIGSELSRW